jgi:hypothetical protein
MILEDEEMIQSLTPHRNGCYFKIVLGIDGQIYYQGGCDLRPNLLTGARRYMYEMLENNGFCPVKLLIDPVLKVELLKIPNCGCDK